MRREGKGRDFLPGVRYLGFDRLHGTNAIRLNQKEEIYYVIIAPYLAPRE